MKIGFTYGSAISLELRSVNKEIILVNSGEKTNKLFDFDKYSFKIAYNKAQIISHMKTPTTQNNIQKLMSENAAENIIKYLNINMN